MGVSIPLSLPFSKDLRTSKNQLLGAGLHTFQKIVCGYLLDLLHEFNSFSDALGVD